MKEFGFWISLEKNIFEAKWLAKHVKLTLEKNNGELEWDYGLNRSIVKLAEAAPENTLEIIRLFWLDGCVRNKVNRPPFHIDEDWYQALKRLYSQVSLKDDVYRLIDDLIREGGSIFWGLKSIVQEKKY